MLMLLPGKHSADKLVIIAEIVDLFNCRELKQTNKSKSAGQIWISEVKVTCKSTEARGIGLQQKNIGSKYDVRL